MLRPSMFDIKYQKMNSEETLLNYERDVMLWEQTEAIKRMSENSNPSNSSFDISTQSDNDILDYEIDSVFKQSQNPFKYGSDLYLKYKKLASICYRYSQKARRYNQGFKSLSLVIFTCLLCFGLPLAYSQSHNNSGYVPLVFYLMGINILFYVYAHIMTRHYIKKAKDADDDLDLFANKYKEYFEKREY